MVYQYGVLGYAMGGFVPDTLGCGGDWGSKGLEESLGREELQSGHREASSCVDCTVVGMVAIWL